MSRTKPADDPAEGATHFQEWLLHAAQGEKGRPFWFFGQLADLEALYRGLYLAGYAGEQANELIQKLFPQPRALEPKFHADLLDQFQAMKEHPNKRKVV